MQIEIRVALQGQYFSVGYQDEIPELYSRCFEPIKICDEPILRAAGLGISQGEAATVMKTRDDAADILSKHIAKLLVLEMKKHDTTNGYKDNE